MELGQSMSRQERVSWEAQARLAELMGQINCLTAQMVDVIAEVLDADAWAPGGGLRSPEHWVAWRTGVAPARAAALVTMARRRGELSECEALFRAGSLTEDAMKVITAKAPADRDHELAEISPLLMHTQLTRILGHLPDQPAKPKVQRERKVSFGFDDDGWWGLNATLPPDEGALVQKALEAARSEVFHERQPDAEVAVRGVAGWADGLVRLAEVGLDALDPATGRGEARGERAQVIIHLNGRSDGDGSARIHLGPSSPTRCAATCAATPRSAPRSKTTTVRCSESRPWSPPSTPGYGPSSSSATVAAATPAAHSAAGCTSITSSTAKTAGSPSPGT